MTHVTVWPDTDPQIEVLSTSDRSVIAQELAAVGIAYRHIPLQADLPSDASQEVVLDAYRGLVDELCAEHGYTLVDVVQLHLDDSTPDDVRETAATARARFLNEHTHDEEEIRYFSHGAGVFYLHIGDRVIAVLCTAGDLLSVPALTTHWFDMGTLPDFTAIRFFRTDDGWVGSFTGSEISASFPTFDELASAALRG